MSHPVQRHELETVRLSLLYVALTVAHHCLIDHNLRSYLAVWPHDIQLRAGCEVHSVAAVDGGHLAMVGGISCM